MQAQHIVREYRVVKLDDLIPDEDNPRVISKADKQKLIRSLQNFPDMMKIRSVVVDEDLNVLAGNQRVYALKEIGEMDELEVMVVSGLSDDEKAEFKLKDNSHYGDWDVDLLLEQFDEDLLFDAGLDFKKIDEVISEEDDAIGDEDARYPIVPEFDERHACVVVVADREIDLSWLINYLGLNKVQSRRKEETGVGYVISVSDFQKIVMGENEDDEGEEGEVERV